MLDGRRRGPNLRCGRNVTPKRSGMKYNVRKRCCCRKRVDEEVEPWLTGTVLRARGPVGLTSPDVVRALA